MLFSTKRGLRSVYKDLTATDINATTGASDALLIDTIGVLPRIFYMFNSTPMDLALWVVHKDMDPGVTDNRLLWMEFPASYNLNYDLASGILSIDPGTYLYVSKAPGASGTTGKFRLNYWG